MKLLYVGCRVRILWSRDYPDLNGTEGVIVGRPDDPEYNGDTWEEFGEDTNMEWVVSPDLWGKPYKEVHGEDEEGPFWEDLYFMPASDQLEPVLPDGLLEEIRSEEIESEILREQALVTVP